jgi:hypothetical protein
MTVAASHPVRVKNPVAAKGRHSVSSSPPQEKPTAKSPETFTPATTGAALAAPTDSEISQAFMTKYRNDGPRNIPRGFERILSVAHRVDVLAGEATTPESLTELMITKDIRRQVFLLEGQLRMYKGRFGSGAEARLEASLAEVKGFEDALGGATYTRAILKAAREANAPSTVVDVLMAKDREAFSSLTRLVAAKWTPNPKDGRVPALRNLYKAFAGENFGTNREDQQFLLRKIAKEVRQVSTESFDLKDLHNGIHDLRRELRWIPVYVEATGGMIQLSDQLNPIPELKALLSDPLSTSKYVKMPGTTSERHVYHLSLSVYTDLMKAILELGAIKDEGEQVDGVAEAYVAAGLAKTFEEGQQLSRELLKLGELESFTARATATQDRLHGEKLLETLAQNVEAFLPHRVAP